MTFVRAILQLMATEQCFKQASACKRRTDHNEKAMAGLDYGLSYCDISIFVYFAVQSPGVHIVRTII